MEVGGRQGKTPIFVKDVPGFFVNRCLSPFSVEVSALVMEGVELETLDKAMRSYGMPVGPITLSGGYFTSYCYSPHFPLSAVPLFYARNMQDLYIPIFYYAQICGCLSMRCKAFLH